MLLIPALLFATIAGLLLAPYYLLPASFAWSIIGFALLLAVFCHRRPMAVLLLLPLVFFLLANLRYPLQFPSEPAIEKFIANKSKLTVVGELLSVRHLTGQRTQLDLRIHQLSDAGGRFLQVDGCGLRLYVAESVFGLFPGDNVKFTSKLRKPRLFGTPGEFHWPRFLAGQNIALTGWLKQADQLVCIEQTDRVLLPAIAQWRDDAVLEIESAVGNERAVLLRALLLGEGKLLPDEIRKTLAAGGISHLFAISGLHLGLLGFFSYQILLLFYRRVPALCNWQPPQRILPLVLLPMLFLYLLATGDAVATRRAFLLALFAALFWLWRYQVNPLRLLLSLAFLSLLYEPLLLWRASWQLSFAGAAGILLWRPMWQTKTAAFVPLLQWPLRLFLVTTAATLATLPLVLANFHLLSPAGLLANLFAVPLVTLVALPIGLTGLFVPGATFLSSCAFTFAGSVLQFILQLVETLVELPGLAAHYLFLNDQQYWAIAFMFLPFVCFFQFPRLRQRFWLGIFFLSLAVGCLCLQRKAESLTLYMLSVGQGESMLLVEKEGQAILIDGGGLYGDRFDVGERLLAPALGQLGVRRLSAVLLSHDHPDHRKGLVFILRHFPVEQFWTGEKTENLHPSLQQVLAENEIPVWRVASGWTSVPQWKRGEMQLFYAEDRNSKNDSSLLLYLRNGEDGILLTGDLERRGVNRLLTAGLPGPVSLLKLPHHGSKYSNTQQLIKMTDPDIALVSAGFANRYRFPARELVDFADERGLPLFRTDTMGTVRTIAKYRGWSVSCWQDGVFR